MFTVERASRYRSATDEHHTELDDRLSELEFQWLCKVQLASCIETVFLTINPEIFRVLLSDLACCFSKSASECVSIPKLCLCAVDPVHEVNVLIECLWRAQGVLCSPLHTEAAPMRILAAIAQTLPVTF